MTKELLKNYHEKFFCNVYSLVYVILGDRKAAEDITADTFVSLYDMEYPPNEDNNIKCFLTVTARNMSINYLKHHEYQRKP